jgi:hypothetical protein
MNNDIEYVQYRPSRDNFKKTWGEELIKSEMVKEYLSLDATTKEGRLIIAKMNEVEEDWKKKDAEYTDVTFVQQKCYDLLHLVAKNDKRPFVCGHIEGWHRTGAVISLMTGKGIDPTTGVLSKDLSFDDFRRCIQLEGEQQPDPTVGKFQLFLHNKLTGSEGHDKCNFVEQTSSMTVYYINVSSEEEEDLEQILLRLRNHSLAISEQKRTSAKKSTEVMIADLMMSVNRLGTTSTEEDSAIDDNSCIYSPCIEITWAPRKKLQLKALQNAMDKAESILKENMATKRERDDISNDTIEMLTFSIPKKLFSTEFADYCKNPFNKMVSERMKQELSFKAVEKPSITISPPFLNTFRTMTMDPGKNGVKAMTTWMVNTCWYLPKIIHILYSQRNNVPLKMVGEERMVQETCMYAVRYHGNAVGLINYNVDLIVQKHYNKMPYSANTNSTSTQLNIIAAALFISDTINITLTHPDEFNDVPVNNETDKQHIERVKRAIGNTALEMAAALSSINTGKKELYLANDIIHALGRFVS